MVGGNIYVQGTGDTQGKGQDYEHASQEDFQGQCGSDSCNLGTHAEERRFHRERVRYRSEVVPDLSGQDARKDV